MNQYLTPDEVEVGRRNLIAELKIHLGDTFGDVLLARQTVGDIIAVLEASKPAAKRPVSDEDVEEFCREAWPKFYDWDDRTRAVFRRTARRALEMPLEASKPTVVDREAVRDAVSYWLPAGETDSYVNDATNAVLAALYPKATEGKS